MISTSAISETKLSRHNESIEEGEIRDDGSPTRNFASAPVPVIQSTVQEGKKENAIDRNKVCPLMLKLYYSFNRHHSPIDYKNKVYPTGEIVIFTWMDATLSELTVHLQREVRKIRRYGTTINFQILSPDPVKPRYRMRDIGSVVMNNKGPDDFKTLSQCRFTIGDMIDICIRLP